MEIPSGLMAFAVIIGVAYWVNSRREDKERVAANEKAAKVAKDKSDVIENAKSKTRKIIRTRAKEFDVDYTDDELDWILNWAVSQSGQKGLENLEYMFTTAPKDKLEQLMMKIEKDHLTYSAEQQEAQRSNEAEYRWLALLGDFNKLNPAQQKTHLAYIKKNTDELTDEQLHTLELISLGDRERSSSKDIMVGDVKLFSLKEK